MSMTGEWVIELHNERMETDEDYREYQNAIHEDYLRGIEQDREDALIDERFVNHFPDKTIDYKGASILLRNTQTVNPVNELEADVQCPYDNGYGHKNFLIKSVDRTKVFVSQIDTTVRCFGCKSLECEHTEIIRDLGKDSVEIIEFAENFDGFISLTDRLKEFYEATRRALNSRLEVFADFERDSFVVRNLDTLKEYRVAIKTVDGKVWTACSCPDFKKRARICKHTSVVLVETQLPF